MDLDLSNSATSLFYWTEKPTSSQHIKWQIPLHGREPDLNRPKSADLISTYRIIFGLIDVCISDVYLP